MAYAKPYQSQVSTSTNAFYQTNKWKTFSAKYKKDNPFCSNCQKLGKVSLAKITDHIIPYKIGGAEYDKRNIQGLCKACDQAKRAMEKNGKWLIISIKNERGELIPGGEVQSFGRKPTGSAPRLS